MKQQAIIVDIDGTLADNSHRVKFVDGSQKKDWNAFNAQSAFDPVNQWCLEIVKCMALNGYKIIFLTARSGSKEIEAMTKTWLIANVGGGVDYALIMRKENDYRQDSITKLDLYNEHVAPLYDVLFALDDRGRVCDMWRSIGIPALHCEEY